MDGFNSCKVIMTVKVEAGKEETRGLVGVYPLGYENVYGN